MPLSGNKLNLHQEYSHGKKLRPTGYQSDQTSFNSGYFTHNNTSDYHGSSKLRVINQGGLSNNIPENIQMPSTSSTFHSTPCKNIEATNNDESNVIAPPVSASHLTWSNSKNEYSIQTPINVDSDEDVSINWTLPNEKNSEFEKRNEGKTMVTEEDEDLDEEEEMDEDDDEMMDEDDGEENATEGNEEDEEEESEGIMEESNNDQTTWTVPIEAKKKKAVSKASK